MVGQVWSSERLPDRVIDGVGEEADGEGGGGEVEVGGERGECAVRARVVVQHGRYLPRGAGGAGHMYWGAEADGELRREKRRGWGGGRVSGFPGFVVLATTKVM